MKFKILLLSAIIFSFTGKLFARPLVDSIGVEELNGKKVILHKLDPKDNYYSLGRKYGVSPKAIIQFNNNASMRVGNIIKIPTDRPFDNTTPTQPVVTAPQQQANTASPAKTSPKQPVNAQQTTPPAVTEQQQRSAQEVANSNAAGVTTQQYKVSAGETLYSIAKRFGTTVEDITATNKLTSSIQPGQILIIRSGIQTPVAAAPVPNPTDTLLAKRDSTMVAPADTMGEHRNGVNKYGLFEKSEKGVATWIDDTSLDANKQLVLHRTAPIGTVMRITNPMTGKSTFAKVVGRFTDNQQTKDVVVVMTKNVAQSLGALDKRFHVNISYGSPNE